MQSKKTLIAGYVRSPFTAARKGALAAIRPDDLSAQVIRALMAKVNVPADEIEDVIWGCAYPEGEQGLNLGRIVSMLAGLPESVSGVTVNRWCGSAMQSVQDAAGMIATNAGDAFICGGVESMSRVPMYGFNMAPPTAWTQEQQDAYIKVGLTAERVAAMYGLTRDMQDQFGFESQAKAFAAQIEGRLTDEIVPIRIENTVVDKDGCIRQPSLEKMAELKPPFLEDGTITAGTTSPMTDGATALLVCADTFASKHGLRAQAEVVSFAVAGCAADVMGLGPIGASRKAMARAGLSIGDIDVVEMNEAFAAQAEACRRELDIAPGKLNVDGGAIALGHPLGATGGRLIGKAAQRLMRGEGRYALATQCIGGGMGIAMVLKAVQ
ncbi:thiolase family protein [Noviherbaspirillum sp. Root189]|uniref:thiolase family protein n=1 Tax=Noviherbaspirillum sp. Root189 TaxID=1736487 RepID=UPI0007094A8A|nr:thiolase family protein [Noviherbaspirillum sp. Root189]KRB70710.1 acetyl-CoA acetyltransferase [Noviherbaspirillum sp. Root189]